MSHKRGFYTKKPYQRRGERDQNKTKTHGEKKDFTERLIEWEEIEKLIVSFQTQFNGTLLREEVREAKNAALLLIERFQPLFIKYLCLIKTGEIDFSDIESKRFVSTFLGDKTLTRALRGDMKSTSKMEEITHRFHFVRETYGRESDERILLDLEMLFLVLAKRYVPKGRNFCAYLYNTYLYEVSRFIKSYIKNPLNIPYRIVSYEDFLFLAYEDRYKTIEDLAEEEEVRNAGGMPTKDWLSGYSCSDVFKRLSVIERTILVKYYFEHYTDKELALYFNLHINTINLKRRKATKCLAEGLGIDPKSLKRVRNQGSDHLLPISIPNKETHYVTH